MGSDANLQEVAATSAACYRLIYRSHSLLAPKDDAGLADILSYPPKIGQ